MAPIVARIISTPVALLLHVAAGLLVIGVARSEFGTPPGTEFPYGTLLLLTLVPLLVSVWWPGATFWRRISAWAAGTAATVASFIAVRFLALEAVLWITLFTDPDGSFLWNVWPLLVVPPVTLLFGILAAWTVLRSGRRTTSSRSPA